MMVNFVKALHFGCQDANKKDKEACWSKHLQFPRVGEFITGDLMDEAKKSRFKTTVSQSILSYTIMQSYK